MKYNVVMRVVGFYPMEVEADSVEEARAKACNEICEVDFGMLQDVDSSFNSACEAEVEH